jgi:hypothetical protein
MLKVFAEHLRQSVMFGIGPDMRIEPTQLTGGASPDRLAQNRLVRIGCSQLLFGGTAVEPIDENAGVNGCGPRTSRSSLFQALESARFRMGTEGRRR